MEKAKRSGQAVIFPGIAPFGFPEVAKFLLLAPGAREWVDRADAVLGESLIDGFREESGEFGEYAKVAFLTCCLALADWGGTRLGITAETCTGPSFGGIPASVYAGALTFEDAVRLTTGLGRHADAYFATEHSDVVTLSFARLATERLDPILAELSADGGWFEMACYVDDDFHLLSIRSDRLDWLSGRIRSHGGLPLYTMRTPMHSTLFRPLRDRVEKEVVSGLTFTDPRLPIVSDHDGTIVTTADGAARMLLDAIVTPVRWPSVVSRLRERDITRVYVAGPDALWGRVGCTTRSFEVVPLTPEGALRPRRRTSAA